MARPDVSVVMPFAGDRAQARAALDVLTALDTQAGDVLMLVDNAGTAPAAEGIRVVRASGEHSPAHARNVGAALASTKWILFIDADCKVSPGLLDAYFSEQIEPEIGALAGEVVPAAGARTVAARYAGARSFLNQEAHLSHAYRPRAVAANLLVRRAAFERVGGFYEGLRAAEDTDLSWRLQAAGWRLEIRPAARVEHRYRSTIGDLRRQWRGYAAGRAWLARRYEGFEPEPALVRAAGRVARIGHRGGRQRSPAGPARPRRAPAAMNTSRLERARYLTLDVLLGVDELVGLTLSNRPLRETDAPAQVVLVAERFPARDDPLVDFACALAGARVEAAARPERADVEATRALRIDYREDDGVAERLLATLRLLTRHPLRLLAELLASDDQGPTLLALAPAALRLVREKRARVQVLGAGRANSTAIRLARLSGRQLDSPAP